MATDRAQARAATRKLVRKSLAKGDVYGWTDVLYRKAERKPEAIPWAECVPNPNLEAWLAGRSLEGYRKDALVVGCGLGDDAERLSRAGFQVAAFDVSPTAIEWCRERFPGSPVRYEVADLFVPPAGWAAGFGFVFESYTLQTFPVALRQKAMRAIASLVAPGGSLLVIARGRNPEEPEGEFPWPLTRRALDVFEGAGLLEVAFEDYMDREVPPVRRFRVEYRR
jgi:SAM-dependent methyltransferase